MFFSGKRALLGAGFIAVLAIGCQDSAEPTSDSLRNVKVPDGFTFGTTREVKLTVLGTEEKLGAAQAALQVALPDGKVVYRGPLSAGVPLAVNLAVPTKDSDLLVKVEADGKWVGGTANIKSDGQASFDFR